MIYKYNIFIHYYNIMINNDARDMCKLNSG